MSGIVPMLRMLKPFPMLGLKFMAGAIPGKKLKKKKAVCPQVFSSGGTCTLLP
jgi:hypothetical protein